MASTVTRKGQVTLPKRLRDVWGIKPGSRVEFDVDEQGRLVLVKLDGERPRSRFERLVGSAGPGPSTDEMMALLRGEG